MSQKVSVEIKSKIDHVEQDYEIIAIANGGIIPATIISYTTRIKTINIFPIKDNEIILNKLPNLDEDKKYLVVDEIYDTGKTSNFVDQYLNNLKYINIYLMKRYKQVTNNNEIYGMILNDPRWVVFPWECETKIIK